MPLTCTMNMESTYRTIKQKTKPNRNILFMMLSFTIKFPDQITLKLSDQVRKKELYAFVIIGKNVINPDENNHANYNPLESIVQYHSNTPTNEDFPRWLTGHINAKIQGVRLQAVQLDPAIVAKIGIWLA